VGGGKKQKPKAQTARKIRIRRLTQTDVDGTLIESPSCVGFYPNSKGEKRKNAPMVRHQGMRGHERISGEALE
jgi:hypothetical protein